MQFIITYMQQIDIENAIKLGNRIKDLRMNSGQSLNSFVMSHSGITTATWSRTENGLTDVKFSSLLRVAAMMDMEIWELLKDIPFNYSFDDE